MKKIIVSIVLLLSVGMISAQKVKMKKGKVLVDKKEYLTYKGDVFSSIDGVSLFTIKKEEIEKDNPKLATTNSNDAIGDRARITSDNGQRRGNVEKKIKVKYRVVKFTRFNLEFETSLSKSKIIKEFYKNNVVNAAGIIDQAAAKSVAYKIKKDITGKRTKI